MFQFQVLHLPLPVRTEGKHEKTSRRIVECPSQGLCNTTGRQKRDLIYTEWWWNTDRTKQGNEKTCN
jgi:hypothetical protein